MTPWFVSVFRAVIGFLLLCHGTSTLFAWPVAPWNGAATPFTEWPGGWAGSIELVAGVLLILGLFTRSAAFVASGTLAVAYFWKHQPDGALPIGNEGESAVLFCWALLALVFLGPGRVALDRLIGRSAPEREPSPRITESVS